MDMQGIEDVVYAPVMIITCNRAGHLRRCVESLRLCTYADQTELYISVDYPPSEKYVDGWKEVKDYVQNIEGFKKVHLWIQENNLGPSRNSLFLRTTVFEEHDRLIFSEDDNEFSPNFLEYIDKGLMLYEKDPRVFGICGYGYNYDFDCENDNVLTLTDFCVWGCGFWREKEKMISEQLYVSVWEKKARNLLLMRRVYRNRSWIFSRMLGMLLSDAQPEVIRKNDMTRAIVLALNGWYTVNPVLSKVRNWGSDGTGVNLLGIREKQERYENQEIDTDLHFEYHISEMEPKISNNRMLDVRGGWNKDRAKWYHDPLTYFLYWILGKKTFFRLVRRKK